MLLEFERLIFIFPTNERIQEKIEMQLKYLIFCRRQLMIYVLISLNFMSEFSFSLFAY